MSGKFAHHVIQAVACRDTFFRDIVTDAEEPDIALYAVKIYDEISRIDVDVSAVTVSLCYKIGIIKEIRIASFGIVIVNNIAVLFLVRCFRKKRKTCGKDHNRGKTAGKDLIKHFLCF